MTSKLNCSVNKFYVDQVKHNRFISFIFVSKTKKNKKNKKQTNSGERGRGRGWRQAMAKWHKVKKLGYGFSPGLKRPGYREEAPPWFRSTNSVMAARSSRVRGRSSVESSWYDGEQYVSDDAWVMRAKVMVAVSMGAIVAV